MTEFDVVVLGGGISGARSALKAADLGGKVCIIEKEMLGKKGFLRRNVLLPDGSHENGKEPNIWEEHLANKKKLAEKFCENLEDKLNSAGIVLKQGTGSLASQNEILIEGDNNSQLVKGGSIILACGSEPSFS